MRRLKMKNKRGQIQGIIAFAGIVLMLIIMAPILLKFVTSILTSTSNQLAIAQPSNLSADTVKTVQGKFTGTLDWAIMLLILFNILILLFTSFLIDVHPVFVIIYIIGAVIVVLTVPLMGSVAEKVIADPNLSPMMSYIPMTEFIFDNYPMVIVAVIVLTGVIMFAKIKLFPSTGGGGGGGQVNY